MKIANVFTDEFDRVEEREGFQARDAWIGARIGSELLGGSVYELDPGQRTWPYHLHHANEEWLLVLRGRPTLRTPEGERELDEGDVVCFRRGPEGAHQVSNRSAATVRVLMLSTHVMPEVLEYPDSGKVAANDAQGKRLLMIRPGPQLDYWDGES